MSSNPNLNPNTKLPGYKGSANAPRLASKPTSTWLWPLAFAGIFGLSFYSYTQVVTKRSKDDRDRLRKKASPSPL
jgi:hypothetical protein